MLSFLGFLPILVLRILDIEANRFYDRNHQMYEAAILTRCYTQHSLHPFIDYEITKYILSKSLSEIKELTLLIYLEYLRINLLHPL